MGLTEGHPAHAEARLQPTAWAQGRAVEAVELTGGGWALGVLWHPEQDAEDGRLFEAHVLAATVRDGRRCPPSQPDHRAGIARSPGGARGAFDDEADAIRIANDTPYGLSGSIWTRDAGRALWMARAVEAGNLSINSHSSVRYGPPFGGFKRSGLGRELGPDALDALTDVKNVFLATEE